MNSGKKIRNHLNRPVSQQKTILDAIREHEYLKPKPVKNPSIPRGGSILSPKPPEMKIYHTICDNGARRIPAYYLGGRRVNALGFGLSDKDLRAIHNNSCKGCNGFRCIANKFASVSTAQKVSKYIPPNCPTTKTYPHPSPYYMGPYPPAPISVPISPKVYKENSDANNISYNYDSD